MKAFAYVNPTNEKEAVAALKTDGIALPLAGGQDLLARMKDYIDSPDRDRQREKRAGRDDRGDARRRHEDRRRGEDRRSCRERAGQAAVSGRHRCGGRDRHAADPEQRHGRRQRESASPVLVLPQRGVRLLQEGRHRAASRWPARTSTTRFSATRGRATSSTRRAWRYRSSPMARSSASSGRTASARFRRPSTSRCRRCRTC